MKTVLILSLMLSGCSLFPQKPFMPVAPASIQAPCPELEQIKPDAKNSDIVQTIVTNYGLYQECSAKNDAWIDWYTKQKAIIK